MGETSSAETAASSPAPSQSTAPVAGRSTAGLSARVRTRASEPWARELAALAFTCLASIVMAVIALQLWDSPDLHQPIAYASDGLGVVSTFKGIQDWGWVWSNPALGAPLGLDYHDYGSHGPENLHWVAVWLISLVAQQPGTAYNAFFMLTFPVSAAAAYGVLRGLNISRLAAVAPAALFAVVPYHVLRGEVGHLLLADTVAVPLGVYLALAIMLGLPLFRRRSAPDGPRLLRWVSWTSVRTVLLIVVIASTGIYYALFTVIFVSVAAVVALLARREGKATVFTAGTVLVVLGAVLAFNLAPTILYTQEHGANPLTAQRDPNESLIYGLNLAGQILPPPTHRFAPFASLGGTFWDKAWYQSEGPTWGGTLSVLGLLLLTLALLAGMAGGRAPRLLADARMRATAVIMATAAFMGATGAGGALVAFVVSPSLRGWNRIGIVLSFCGLVAVALALDALRKRWQERGRPRLTPVFAGVVGVVLVFGVWDQTSPEMRPPYEQTSGEFASDARFVAAISDTLGGRGEVYQLPYVAYPESPPKVHMVDYSHLKGYAHAPKDIKWSYAAMKGRPADWQGDAAALPVEDQLRAVALAGFDGLWVDTFGYVNPDAEILRQAAALTRQQPIVSQNGRLQYFDLRPLRARLLRETPPAEAGAVGTALTHPVELAYGAGFYPVEQDTSGTWRWAQARARITLDNPRSEPRPMTFEARLTSGRPSNVAFTLDGRSVGGARATPGSGSRAEVTFTLPPGKHVLELASDAPQTTPAPGDTRDLRLQVSGSEILDAPIAALDSP
ncbi:hypothetical protein OJ998_20710 [Solirubrobacter taibaiensis]|nr:hypothetical protein [Solirubrobacter taibaiensis]